MVPLMVSELLPAAKASWADVDPITCFASRIGTFNPDRVCEVA